MGVNFALGFPKLIRVCGLFGCLVIICQHLGICFWLQRTMCMWDAMVGLSLCVPSFASMFQPPIHKLMSIDKIHSRGIDL